MSSGTRGNITESHGPLQRLVGATTCVHPASSRALRLSKSHPVGVPETLFVASDSLTHSQCGLPALANTLRTEPLRLSWTANLTGFFMPYSLAPHRRSMLVKTGPSHRAVVCVCPNFSAISSVMEAFLPCGGEFRVGWCGGHR